jgi:hypothetical protein
LRLLLGLGFASLRMASASDRTDGRTVCCTFARIVTRDLSDQRSGCCATNRTTGACALRTRLGSLFLLSGLLLLLLGVFRNLERIDSRIAHCPAVALGLVLRLLRSILASAWKYIHFQC